MHPAVDTLRNFVASYGYWAVALALLSESAGLPVPGEITLLLASFLAYSEHHLHLGWIIVVATCASTFGGEVGYAVGHHGGRQLLDRYKSMFKISSDALDRGEKVFAEYGAAAVFLSRFIFGMRVFAGPLAGVLRMPRRVFSIFNFLGAATWVTIIAGAGYIFGGQWRTLLHVMRRFNLFAALIAVAAIAILGLRIRYRNQRIRNQRLLETK